MTPQPNPETAITPKTTVAPRPTPAALSRTPATKTTSLQSGQICAGTLTRNPLPESLLMAYTTAGSTKTNAAAQKPSPQASLKTIVASLSNSAAKAKPKRKCMAKTSLGWKRMAKRAKNDAYNDPGFQSSSKAVDFYVNTLKWDQVENKPVDISQQEPYRQLIEEWEMVKKRPNGPSASIMEAIRIMNDSVMPAAIVDMLAKAGWDAKECCNPKLSPQEKRLNAGSKGVKRSIEVDEVSSPQAKKRKTAAAMPQGPPPKAMAPALEILTTEAQLPLGSLKTVKNDRIPPMPFVPRPLESHQPNGISSVECEGDEASNHPDRGGSGIEFDPCVPKTVATASNDTQTDDPTNTLKLTKPTDAAEPSPVITRSTGTSSTGTSSSTSSKRKGTSRKELKQVIDTVGNTLTAVSASHSLQLQDQARRLGICSESLDEHSDQLHGHSNRLKQQGIALAQVCQDNQVLRDCLRDILLPLAQAVSTLHKPNKVDKQALKSTKQRAEKELKELKSADKTARGLKRSLEHWSHVLAPGAGGTDSEQAAGGKHGAQERED